ncbi:MAG: hypothetical protein WCC37_01095 [Candidatus Sulfotelmatobacter sp.]
MILRVPYYANSRIPQSKDFVAGTVLGTIVDKNDFIVGRQLTKDRVQLQ